MPTTRRAKSSHPKARTTAATSVAHRWGPVASWDPQGEVVSVSLSRSALLRLGAPAAFIDRLLGTSSRVVLAVDSTGSAGCSRS